MAGALRPPGHPLATCALGYKGYSMHPRAKLPLHRPAGIEVLPGPDAISIIGRVDFARHQIASARLCPPSIEVHGSGYRHASDGLNLARSRSAAPPGNGSCLRAVCPSAGLPPPRPAPEPFITREGFPSSSPRVSAVCEKKHSPRFLRAWAVLGTRTRTLKTQALDSPEDVQTRKQANTLNSRRTLGHTDTLSNAFAYTSNRAKQEAGSDETNRSTTLRTLLPAFAVPAFCLTKSW